LYNGRKIINYGLHRNNSGYPAFQLNSTKYPLGTLRIPLIGANNLTIKNRTRSVRDIIIETLSDPRIDNMIISAINYTTSVPQYLADNQPRPYRNDETAFLAKVKNVAGNIGDQSPIDFGPPRPTYVHIRRNDCIIGCYGNRFGNAFQLQDSHPLGELRVLINGNQQINNIVNSILNAMTIDDIIDFVIASAIRDTP
jgi:hypothetical protein